MGSNGGWIQVTSPSTHSMVLPLVFAALYFSSNIISKSSEDLTMYSIGV